MNENTNTETVDRTYTYDGIEFSYNPTLRKWHFKTPAYEIALACKGGIGVANRAVKIIAGGLKRCRGEKIDSLAKFHLKKLAA